MRKAAWLLALFLVACGTTRSPPGGKTRQAALSLTAGNPAEEVQVLLFETGAVVAWTEREGGNPRLYLAERAQGDWGPPRPVSASGQRVYAFRLAGDREGRAVLAWREGDRVRALRREGGAWQGPDALAQADPMRIAAAVDGAGRPWVAWRQKDGSDHRIRAARYEAGWRGDWVSPSSASARTPDLAARGDQLLLVWEQNFTGSEIGYAFYQGGWQTPGSFRSGLSNNDPKAALAGPVAAIAWHASAPSGDWCSLALFTGGAWDRGTLGNSASRCRLAGGDGRILASWLQAQSGRRVVFAKFLPEGKDMILSLQSGDASPPVPAFAGEFALVAWIEEDAGGTPRVYAALHPGEG